MIESLSGVKTSRFDNNPVLVEREIRYHALKDSLCRTKGRLLCIL